MSNTYKPILETEEDPSFIDDNFIQPDDYEQPSRLTNVPKPQPQAQPQVIRPTIPVDSNSHMFQIAFYRKFFDLDSDEFFQKISRALNPLNPLFEDNGNEGHVTELYGFFWITGTLIFLMFVSSTGSNILADWLYSDDGDQKYDYNFDLLTLSISLFYGYNLLVPFLLYGITSYVFKFPNRLQLTSLISIYGYTNILWIPITLVNFFIVIFISNKKHSLILNLLEWIIVIVSGAITGLSNFRKIGPLIQRNTLVMNETDLGSANKQYYIILGALAVAHILFTVLVKISFFGIGA